MAWRKDNRLHDDNLGIRSHSRYDSLQDLDEIFIRPAMANVAHHVDVCSVCDLRVEEIVSLVRDFALEIRWEGFLIGFYGFFEILDDEFQVGEAF